MPQQPTPIVPTGGTAYPSENPSGISNNLLIGVAWFGLAFWLYYAFLRQVAGPLNPDEIYFSHQIWLINQGKRQYIDFYSSHLPAYFQLVRPLVAAISSAPTDLSFLWGLRALSGVIIAAYLALAWKVRRDALPHAGPASLLGTATLLLVFVVLARMVEVRTDTIGLLLMNIAWAIALSGSTTRRMAAAALLAGLAILFSARAAGMAGVFGLLLLYIAGRSRNWAAVRALLGVAAAFVAAGLVLYVVAPEWVALVIRSCFVEPRNLSAAMPFQARFLTLDRLPVLLLVVGGLFAGVRLLRQGQADRGLIVAVACGAQLLMVLLDPAPHQYVFAWAAVPAVLGLVSVSLPFAVGIPAFIAAALIALSIAHGIAKGTPPPTISYYRLTFDATLGEREIAQLPTPELVSLLVTDKLQKNLTTQLRVRSEVCRRIGGTTLAHFDTHPVCLDDATFYWTWAHWPPLVEGDRLVPGAMSHQELGRVLSTARPGVIVWGRRWEAPRPLLPATRQMLACCYELHDGFAVLKTARER